MKNFASILLLISSAVLLGSCKDNDLNPAPSYTSVGLVNATVDPEFASYNLARSRASVNSNPERPVFKFTVDLYSQRDLKITKVYVYKTLRRGSSSYTYSARALAAEVTTFPTTLSFDSQTALTGLYRIGTTAQFISGNDTIANAPTLLPYIAASRTGSNQVFAGDAIVFTYEYEVETANGTERLILTPPNQTEIIAPSAQTVEVITGAQINAPFAVVAPFK